MTKERAIEIIERKTSIPNEGETFEEIEEAFDMAASALKEKPTDEVVQKIRTAIAVNLYEIAGKFDESYGDAAIYLQELIDKAVSE